MTAPKITPEVERAAEAIHALIHRPPGTYDPAVVTIAPEDIARAVLRSLLPPSDAMIEAAAREICAWDNGTGGSWRLDLRPAKRALTAAIRAAIGDEAT